jgi:malate dehydrogenase (oxaloacetate-decarboxylating)
MDARMKIPSPSYALTLRLRYPDEAGLLGRLTSLIGEAHGYIGAVDIVEVRAGMITRDFTVNTSDVEHGEAIVARIREVPSVEVLKVSDRTFLMHLGGKIEVNSKVPVKTRDDLSMAYTPGVARVCRAIYEDDDAAFNLTIKRNTVAVVSDGSAVLGMGDIGPKAAMPVMEGKALLFKEFAGVDAFPICLDTQDVDAIVNTVKYLSPTFGGINLEDISSPRCVEIERRLDAELDIPVFHDDQHGTAIVVLAALTNALKVVDKSPGGIRVAMSGAGSAGMAIARLLKLSGVEQIVVCDRTGAIYQGRTERMNPVKDWIAENTNPDRENGSLSESMRGADVFIGVSAAGLVSVEDVQGMAGNSVVFALANPDPEIAPQLAEPHVGVIATGRSDYANQINNVLCFPGLFRGLLDVRASTVTDGMKRAAAIAIASVISDEELSPQYIIPSVFNRKVAPAVANAIAEAAIAEGVARKKRPAGESVEE